MISEDSVIVITSKNDISANYASPISELRAKMMEDVLCEAKKHYEKFKLELEGGSDCISMCPAGGEDPTEDPPKPPGDDTEKGSPGA